MKRNFIFLFFLSFCILWGCASKKPLLDEVFDQANKVYDKEQYDRAAKCYEEFLMRNQESALRQVALYHLAECYKHMGEAEEAIAMYDTIINQYKEGFWVEQSLKDKQEVKEVLENVRIRNLGFN